MFLSPYGGFDVQLIAQMFGSVPADIAGYIAVTAGLSAFALLLRLDQTRKADRAASRREQAVKQVSPTRRLEPGHDWAMVTYPTMKELARAPDVLSLHLHAARQLDATEHAFNRLIADCASVGCKIVRPTFEPVQQLVREPVARPRPQSLAA